MVAGLYKGASFVLQAICFLETGIYYSRQTDLLPNLSLSEQKILQTCIHLKNGGTVDFEDMSETMMTWCQTQIQKYH